MGQIPREGTNDTRVFKAPSQSISGQASHLHAHLVPKAEEAGAGKHMSGSCSVCRWHWWGWRNLVLGVLVGAAGEPNVGLGAVRREWGKDQAVLGGSSTWEGGFLAGASHLGTLSIFAMPPQAATHTHTHCSYSPRASPGFQKVSHTHTEQHGPLSQFG